MTTKDYERIATAIRLQREGQQGLAERGNETAQGALLGIDGIARHLAMTLKLDNPRFDRDRFLAACGVAEK